MDAIKKKMHAMKQETEAAKQKAAEHEAETNDTNNKADQVRRICFFFLLLFVLIVFSACFYSKNIIKLL